MLIWNQKFAARGVDVIGVHTPETPPEYVTENVRHEVEKLGITYPVLLDGQHKNWNRWNQEFWPTVYLIDKHGLIRYRWGRRTRIQPFGWRSKDRIAY
jgi:hypothetical protein